MKSLCSAILQYLASPVLRQMPKICSATELRDKISACRACECHQLTSAITTLASSLRSRFIALDKPDRCYEYISMMALMHAGTEVDDGALHVALLALERVGASTRIGYGQDALYALKPPLPLPAAMQASPQGGLQHPFVHNSTMAGTSLHCIRLRCPVCSQATLHVPEAMLASPQGELFAGNVLSVRARSL